jgi:hypothetical protein
MKILWAKFIILNEHPVSRPFYDIANSQDYENTLINIDPLGTMYIATCGILWNAGKNATIQIYAQDPGSPDDDRQMIDVYIM